MGKYLKAILFGLGCAASAGALAQADGGRALAAADESILPVVFQVRPADDALLASLCAGMAAPLPAHRPGVILWDEPRPGVPPAPRAAASVSESVTTSASIFRR